MIEEIIKKAKAEKKQVYVYAHKFPDGDAISSASAIVKYLQEQGVNAKYVVTKENWSYSSVVGKISPTRSVEKDGISLIVDTSTVSYAENELFRNSKKEDIYVIDHHGKVENSVCIEDELEIPSENVIRDPKSSSTCEILVKELKEEKITPKIADMLTLGLITDTARLKFLKQDTLQNLLRLIELGADYEKISSCCHQKSRLRDEVGLAKLFLGVQRFQIGDTFATIMPVDNKTVKELNVNYGIRNPQKKIFKMADIENCSFNCMFAENIPGKYDLEFRSNTTYGNFNVLKLATIHKGGGHHNASGCALSQTGGFSQKSIASTIQQQAIEMYARQGANLTPIQLTKQDEELVSILDHTNRLTTGVTPEILGQVDRLMKQGANYEYLFKQFRTFERFMLENEILSRVSKDKLFDRAPIVNISLSPQEVETLQQKYEVSEKDILDAISVFADINISKASITLPSGKKAQIDRQANVRQEIKKEERIR